ncbi:uncharacterized protein Z520_10457 [Fonsecaea multimorphosa CBS 102226]|uniref:N-acetyltransferase domain-containing protein n=1 Tax=Fonsecaea multimorphosa CBS 102226 TaxID=1442371 RepID=A0A0D2JKP5_9EURO|nr:uncharacterized protein Z520_10457 [Fonsecaea multimorphosa CBS 102226]KIX93832.1 hypothetical protein Z520_10457 [Fonsecaea multimorphosa CBS 102226]OAL19072.1 hypothetical protein AYO22_10020 [Fonsecaea multimorphosa]
MATTSEKMEASAVTVNSASATSLVDLKGRSAVPMQSLPPTTASQSPEYCHRLADISSRATVSEPLNIVFQQEKTGRATAVTPELLYTGAKGRIETKVAAGAWVVEAANFAAVACWEPPSSNVPPFTEAQFAEMARERPVFAQFARDIQAARLASLGPDQPYWTLSLMARDPQRKDKGAVRAVIEPYIKRAKEEKLPLWLVAGNTRARDIYAYFGFRVVKLIWSYPRDRKEGDEGVPTWCMVCNWPVE